MQMLVCFLVCMQSLRAEKTKVNRLIVWVDMSSRFMSFQPTWTPRSLTATSPGRWMEVFHRKMVCHSVSGIEANLLGLRPFLGSSYSDYQGDQMMKYRWCLWWTLLMGGSPIWRMWWDFPFKAKLISLDLWLSSGSFGKERLNWK